MIINPVLLSALSISKVFSHATRKDLSNNVVNTTNGQVIGHSARNRSDVVEYLGIPFAQPPLGQLRFDAPRSYNQTGIYNASEYSPGCPYTPAQPIAYPNATPQEPRILAAFNTANGSPLSEDCLTLNIWSKAESDRKGPVLVFFYGGSKCHTCLSEPFLIANPAP